MHPTPILAAVSKEPTTVLDALPYLTGMLVVLVTLAVLWGVCALTAKLIKLVVREPAASAPVAASAPAPAPTVAAPVPSDAIAPEIVAAIAATVACFAGPAHRIISIKPQNATWERAGRQSVLTSHRIR